MGCGCCRQNPSPNSLSSPNAESCCAGPLVSDLGFRSLRARGGGEVWPSLVRRGPGDRGPPGRDRLRLEPGPRGKVSNSSRARGPSPRSRKSFPASVLARRADVALTAGRGPARVSLTGAGKLARRGGRGDSVLPIPAGSGVRLCDLRLSRASWTGLRAIPFQTASRFPGPGTGSTRTVPCMPQRPRRSFSPGWPSCLSRKAVR